MRHVSSEAGIYDARKAVAAVPHGRDFYNPNDKENKGRVPNFELTMGRSPAGRIHNGKAFFALAQNCRDGARIVRRHGTERQAGEQRSLIQ